jgi:hypothetical protein
MTESSHPPVPKQATDPLTVFRARQGRAGPAGDDPHRAAADRLAAPARVLHRLGPARHATHDNLAFQLRDIERQAGVRRTL